MRSKGDRRPNAGDTPEATVVRSFTIPHTPLLSSQRPRDSPNCQRQIHTAKRLKHHSTRETEPSTSLCRSYSCQWRFLVLVSYVMQLLPPELSISQEIGLSIFQHQHFIHGQTILYIHENSLENYHRPLIYHPPPRMGI
jgi:hypothetical protein